MSCIQSIGTNCSRVINGLARDFQDVAASGIDTITNFVTTEDAPETNICLKTAKFVAKVVINIFSCIILTPITLGLGCFLFLYVKIIGEPAPRKAHDEETQKVIQQAALVLNTTKSLPENIITSRNLIQKDQFLPALECWLSKPSEPNFLPEGQEEQFITKLFVRDVQKRALKSVQESADRFSLFTIPGKEKILAFCKTKLKISIPSPQKTNSPGIPISHLLKDLYTKEDLDQLRQEIG